MDSTFYKLLSHTVMAVLIYSAHLLCVSKIWKTVDSEFKSILGQGALELTHLAPSGK
jgi:hypothetical protein